MSCVGRFLRLILRPRERPEVKAALAALDAKKDASATLRDTMKSLSERI